MRLMAFLAALALISTTALAESQPPNATPSKRIAKIIARSDGRSAESAFKVRSVREEYEILAALGLEPGTQSLVASNKRNYDVIEGKDVHTGTKREVWFDIGSFYPGF